MNLEQIVKETVAKIVAEKKGKDLTGDGKIDSKDYLKARSNAIEKAKGLDEDNINDFDDVAGYIIDLIVDEGIITPEEAESDEVINNALEISEKMFGGYGTSGQGISTSDYNRAARALVASLNKSLNEDHKDHEVSMAQSSLNSILRSAMELKAKIGNQEINIPAWIQDHITNSENFIDQASQGYHEYSNGGHEGEEMNEARVSQDNVVNYLANSLEYVWSAGKGNNSIDFQDFAQSLYFDIFGGDEMNEANLGHNEISSIEQEDRFWIVKYGTKEKVFDSEKEARAFYDEFNKAPKMDEAKESNDDKIAKYEKYTYTLDGETVKPEITFLNNILKAILSNKIYNIGAPENGKVELSPESGKKGMYNEAEDISDEELDQLQVTADDTSKMPAERDAARNKIYASRAKKESQELDEYVIRRWQHYAGIK
jgi:hypothetical protein